jgi:site-specific recombinase XerC
VYVLERMRKGQRYTIKLTARDDEEAERELAAFDRDPVGYQRPTAAPVGGLTMNEKTIQEVIDAMKARDLTPEHRYGTRLYLLEWSNALRGAAVESLTLERLERLLADFGTARRSRIVALKSFCGYHFRRGNLKTNPAARLQAPKVIAAKNFAPRHYERHEIERAYAETKTQIHRDMIRLGIAGGLHVVEIGRFARGIGRLVKVDGQGEIAGVLWVLHKSGEQHPVALNAAGVAAAERVRARGSIVTRPRQLKMIHRVAQRLRDRGEENVRPVLYGALRHSFVTLARSAGGRVVRPKLYGVSLEEIREVVGHTSTKTTRIYDGTEIPPMIVVSIELQHPDDPPLEVDVPRGKRAPGGRRSRTSPASRRAVGGR